MLTNAADETEDELVFTMLITRHGARSPTDQVPSDASITSDSFKIYLGDLTHSGERQHYLEGTKFKKIYAEDEEIIDKNFNPNEFYVESTDFNRTLMSAYSQMLGYFPIGSLPELSKAHTTKANPPFKFNGDNKVTKRLRNKATESSFQPVPIHVSGLDDIMRAMDKDVCPYQSVLRKQYTETDEWEELNEKYQQQLFPELHEKYGIKEENLDFSASYTYIDNYYSAWFEQMDIEKELSPEAKTLVDEILRDGLYEGFYGLDLAVRLATTRFFDFLRQTLAYKINAVLEVKNTPEFYKEIKYMYLSSHDTSLTAIMSGLQQKQDEPPFFASNIIFELRRKKNSNANDKSDFTVTVKWNGKDVNLGGKDICENSACPFPIVDQFLESRLYDGDLDHTCKYGPSSTSKSSAWLFVLLAIAIFIALSNIGYFVMRSIKNKKRNQGGKAGYNGFEDEENSLKNDINKSKSTISATSRYMDENSD